MPAQDQLEIIDPQGRIRFYPLDPAKGLTNIGRHLDNDLILNRPGVAAFHAMLDHRSRPYTLVVLARNEKTLLDGEPAPINVPTELKSWAAIEIGGHQIIYLAAEDAQTAAQPVSPIAVTELPSQLPATQEVPPAPSSPPNSQIPALLDPALTVEPSSRALAVDPGQTAALDLAIVNGGYKPLKFAVTLDGLDPAWVTVTPPELEVPARQRAVVSIAIAPPRQPAARAGTHTASLTVTTPAFPDWKNQSRLAVTVNPYTEFSVSEIAPRAQTLYPNASFVQAKLEVTNRGNAETAFRLTGEDERYACRYEFKLPDDSLSQPRQAELRLGPGESASVAVRITPIARLRAGLGPRRHFFTVTVAPPAGQAAPRAVLGEVREQPLFGPLASALTAFALIALAVFIFRPSIAAFTAAPTHIQVGQDVTLSWSAAPLASLRISPDIGPVPGPDGRMTIAPTKDTVYTLVAENFLSWINADWFRATREVAVLVDPVLPGILFTTDRDSITAGESVTLTWQVSDAEQLILIANGIPESILPGQFTGSRTIQLDEDTEFVLQARNEFTTTEGVSAALTIRVMPVEATAVPTAPPQPVIDRFEISPAAITAGGQVTIYWSVSGVDTVFIEPLPGEFPPSGNMVVSPAETTAFVLSAISGDTPVRLVKRVVVNPAPGAPLIESFTATPSDVAPGSPEASNVRLAWRISGETTDVQLSGPGLGPATNLPTQGELLVAVNTTSTFTLTAYNGALNTTQSVQVNVTAPAPALLSFTPSTATAGGAPVTLTLTGSGFVNGAVVQWNGSPRSTTFVSSTQLLAAVTAADLANAGSFNVTVFNPAPGGGLSSAQPFTVNNPAPIITGLAPNTTTAGGPSFALVINGSGFNTQTIVRWNGSPRTVSAVTPTQITVLITASDIAAPGTATVSVVNPVPGGGSDASVFTIVAPTPTPTPTLTPTPTATP